MSTWVYLHRLEGPLACLSTLEYLSMTVRSFEIIQMRLRFGPYLDAVSP